MTEEKYVEVAGWAEQREHAAAAEAWILKRTVALAIGPDDPRYIGSGVVVEIAGRMLLATVAHNFRDVAGFDPPAFTVVPPASSSATTLQKVKVTFPATLDQVHLLPSSEELDSDSSLAPLTDLAWMDLQKAPVRDAGLIGVKEDEMVQDPALRADSLFAVTGVPGSLIESESSISPLVDYRGKRLKKTQLALTLYTHFTVPKGSGAEDAGEQVVQYEDQELDPNGALVESPRPRGMSGGGLWEVVLKGNDDSLDVACRLRGLIRARLPGKLLVIPIQHWLQFVRDAAPELCEGTLTGEQGAW